MGNKKKSICPNNLMQIRKSLGFTLEQMGEILGVSARMICNYELNECNLPLDKAFLLSQKYGYSLDWIYCNDTAQNKNSTVHFDPPSSKIAIMTNKKKPIYENNLFQIRTALCLTQKQMGEILGVSARMICNYELNECNLPLDKAFLLSQKYNYSLDWIYCNDTAKNRNSTVHSDPSQLDKFVVDIRDFISQQDNKIYFAIPENYWTYINKLNSIMKSPITDGEKKREKARLDGDYKAKSNSKKIWALSIPKEQLSTYLCFDPEQLPYVDKKSIIPFVDDESIPEYEPTEDQLKEVQSFLWDLTK